MNDNDFELFEVKVISWDGYEYKRSVSKSEIDENRAKGFVKEDGYLGVTIDFRKKSR